MTPVRIYTLPHCPDCLRAKRFLEHAEIPYEEINVEENEEARKWILEVNEGKLRIPSFQIGDQYIGNPPLVKLAQILYERM